MSKATIKEKQSSTDGSLALPPNMVIMPPSEVVTTTAGSVPVKVKSKKTPEFVQEIHHNPYQPFLDKFFPDGDFTPEKMTALCHNLIEFKLQYQNICEPQAPQEQLYQQAISSDDITISTWRDQWLIQAEENEQAFECSKNTVMSEHNKYQYQPGIIAGSGPSLRKNAHELKNRGNLSLVSCAHNFGYFVDQDIHPEYYVQLDAGHITVDELGQGGKRDNEYYWEKTKDYTLIASTVINPTFARKWKGKILWYGTVIPDHDVFPKLQKASPNKVFFQTGGNALGAAYYMSRAILGCTPSVFVGADFSFAYNQKFHPFNSPYDSKFSGVIPRVDVYGNRVATWQSYANFADWFLFQSQGGKGNNPTFFINCTEGGILGSSPNGNINTIKQMPLKALLYSYNMSNSLPGLIPTNGETPQLLF